MADKTAEQKTADELKKLQDEIKAKDVQIKDLEAKLKNIASINEPSALTHEFVPIPGVGVIVAFTYGQSLSSIFVPGVTVKNNNVVSINAV